MKIDFSIFTDVAIACATVALFLAAVGGVLCVLDLLWGVL